MRDGGALAILALVLPAPRDVRARRRLRHPRAAARLDGATAATAPVLGGAAAVAALSGLVPGPPGSPPRIYPLGLALGLLLGIPPLRERQRLRARLATAETPAPVPEGDGPDDPRSLARDGRSDAARVAALRALRAEPPALRIAAGTGLLLCRSGAFGAGVEVLERAEAVVSAARSARRRAGGGDAETADEREVRLALTEGLRLRGRLREALVALDGGPRPLLPDRT